MITPTSNPVTRMRQALADIAAEAAASKGVPFEPFAYVPAGDAPFPIGFIEVPGTEPVNGRNTWQEITVRLVVLVGEFVTADAQEAVDSLLAGGALATAVLADQTLAGTAGSITFLGTESLDRVQIASYNAWGHQWLFQVTLPIER